MKIITGIVLATFLIVSTFSSHAFGQSLPDTTTDSPASQTIALPDPLTPEAVRSLVSTLSDQQVRELLLERLDAVAKKEIEQNTSSKIGLGTQISEWVGQALGNISEAVTRLPRVFATFKISLGNFYAKHSSDGILKMLAIVIASIAAGLAAEFVVNRLVRTKRQNSAQFTDGVTLGQTLKILGTRLFWDLIALVVFFMVTRAIGRNLVPTDMAPIVSDFMLNLVVLPRLAWAFSRFVNAPFQPEMRMLNSTDEVARFFHWNFVGLATFVGFASFLLNFQFSNGVEIGDSRLGFWLNAILFIWFVCVVYIGRKGLTSILIGKRPEEVTPAEHKVAQFFPWFLIGFTIFTWFVVEIIAGIGRFDLLDGRQYIIMTIVSFVPALDTMIRGLVRHMVPPMQGQGIIANRAYHSTKRSYIRILRVILFTMVIVLIARMLEVDFENMTSAGVGEVFAARIFEIMMIVAIGYLIWEVITLLINRKLAAEMTAAGFDLDDDEPGGGEGGGAGGSRLSTVLPMIRFTLQIIIVAMTALLALSNAGVDITPLLAGAGVLGIAIGFGAQSLVKDVVSGVFFLVEDAFRVGEYLNINDTVGTVEKITIRSLQLRHHNGPVHTIPFGEIPKVTNMSRDWVIMKLKWTLPFGTDPNQIKRLFKQIGKEMMEADYAENIIQTFKSQGVYDVDDVGIVIRGKFMAKPGTQWIMRKDVYSRVQKKLEEHGIEFARREVRVNVPGLEESTKLDDAGKNTIEAAAAHGARPDDTPKAPMPDTP